MDAYLAAFANASGLQIASFDRDFKQFTDLDLLLLDSDLSLQAADSV